MLQIFYCHLTQISLAKKNLKQQFRGNDYSQSYQNATWIQNFLEKEKNRYV